MAYINKHRGLEDFLLPHLECFNNIDFWDGPDSQACKWEEKEIQKNHHPDI